MLKNLNEIKNTPCLIKELKYPLTHVRILILLYMTFKFQKDTKVNCIIFNYKCTIQRIFVVNTKLSSIEIYILLTKAHFSYF